MASARRSSAPDAIAPPKGWPTEHVSGKQIVAVWWEDAAGSGEWVQYKPGTFYCLAIGILQHEDENRLAMTVGIDLENGNVCGYLDIPKFAVRKIKRIGRL